MANPYQYSNSTIRLALADDHPMFRSGLSSVLKQHTDFHIVGEASNGRELVQIVQEQCPDIVLTDINMPEMCGLQATQFIRKHFHKTNVIGLSMLDGEHTIQQMLGAGAKGYLLKNVDAKEIVSAIYTVYNNGFFYCSAISKKVGKLLSSDRVDNNGQISSLHLNERDIDIIQMLCQQQGSKEIAASMNITCRAVEGARQRIQEKIGARNMVGIVVFAIRNRIFSID